VSEPADDRIRLGGMALRNGILVHSYDHWAAAVRTPDGRIEMASGRKPELPEALVGTPLLRGVARMAELVYLLPTLRRRLPSARLPVEAPGLAAALAGSTLLAAAVRRSRLPATIVESVAAGVSLVPALAAVRGSQLAGYHGAEHKVIGGYEQGTDDIDVAKEHERCGTHMVGPLLAATAIGNALAARAAPNRRRPARMFAGVAAVGVAGEAFAWMTRHRDHPLSQALARPGFAMQRVAATREPTAAEMEVARAALEAVLRLEEAA
jgi:uncharacterized protein YqhQ